MDVPCCLLISHLEAVWWLPHSHLQKLDILGDNSQATNNDSKLAQIFGLLVEAFLSFVKIFFIKSTRVCDLIH